MNSEWVVWKSLIAKKVSDCYGSHWLLCKLTGYYAKSAVALKRLRQFWKVSSRFEKSVGAMEVIGRHESHWLLWKSLVAMQIDWLLGNVSGRYGEVTTVVEIQRSL
jgi:hypothetical protein